MVFKPGNCPWNKGVPTGRVPWNKGRCWTPEERARLSAGNRGKPRPLTVPRSEQWRRKQSEAKLGKTLEAIRKDPDSVAKQREHMRQLGLSNKGQPHPWLSALNRDPAFTKSRFRGLNIKPNKLEQKVISAIQAFSLPYRFVGDGSVVLNNISPDFINYNGGKAVVEVFGDCFHAPEKSFKTYIPEVQTEAGRRKRYAELGYRMLVLWASELKNATLEEIAQKVLAFDREVLKDG